MFNYLKYLAFAILIGFTMFGCTNKDDTYWPAFAGGGAESEGNGEDNGGGEEVPTYVVSAMGGNGGAGGALLIRSIGQVNILKAGAVDTTFTSSYAFTPDFGLVKATVGSDYLVRNMPPAQDLVVGDLFTKWYDERLYVVTEVMLPEGLAKVTDPYQGITYREVTGLEVAEGAVMSIEANRDCRVDLEFSEDLVILGTVKPVWKTIPAELTPMRPVRLPDTPDLEICTAGHIQSGAASLITVAGTAETETVEEPKEIVEAKDAGDVELDAMEGMLLAGKIDASGGLATTGKAGGGGSIKIDSLGTIVNNGPMTVKSGDGASIHDCGGIEINSTYHVFNTGELDARGGTATADRGGQPSRVEIVAERGSLFNSGDILATAGNGASGGGSSSHDVRDIEIDIRSDHHMSQAVVSLKAANDLTNSGDIEASGGNATVDGSGGSAGTIELISQAGDVKSSGKLTANGGNAKEPELPTITEEAKGDSCDMNYRGGFGGMIRVKISAHEYGFIYEMLPQLSMTFGNVALSGDLEVNGGTSGLCESLDNRNGCFEDRHHGRAGKIEIGNYLQDCYGPAMNVNLLGYTDINAAGGDSNRMGGAGGIVMINVPFDFMFAADEMRGNARNGHSDLNNLRLLGTGIVNQAALDLSGGDGVYFGGKGGMVMAASEGPISNEAAANLAAGNGIVGGNGHSPLNRSLFVLASGTKTTNIGALILKGGDSVAPVVEEGVKDGLPDPMVGGGGFVGLFSQKAQTANSASINVAPGSGLELTAEELAERVGLILIDLFDVTPADGILTL